MAEIGMWHSSPVAVTVGPGRAERAGGVRLAVRLWTWLHAEALTRGMAGGAGDVAVVEDDRRRLAVRRGERACRR